jgi:hypothetical protein
MICGLLAMTGATVTAQNPSTNFAGSWVLDTKRTKDLPETLEQYRLQVSQDAERITIQTEVRGSLRSARRGGGMPGGLPGGGRGGGRGMGGGGMGGGGGAVGVEGAGGGMGRGGMGGGMGAGGGEMGGMSIPREMIMQMALSLSPAQVIFPIDGQQTELRQEARPTGEGQPSPASILTRLKGVWKKNGSQLELVTSRTTTTQNGERTLTARDRWEIEKDGTLVVRRNIETPVGYQEAKLYFQKAE